MSQFILRDHTADVAVEARGESLGAAFAAAADGLAAAQCASVPDGRGRFDVAVEARSRETLLFDYLDELIYRRDLDGVLPVDNEATVTAPDDDRDAAGADGRWRLSASARGLPVSRIDGREVKAVTYSEMRVERDGDGWHVYVVLDV